VRQHDCAENDDGKGDQNFVGGHGDGLQMHGDTAHHDGDESDRECGASAMSRGEAADRNDRSEMIDADDRMAEAGQNVLAESRGHAAPIR